MSDKERIAELEELNRRLSNQLVRSADRLQESVKQIKAEGLREAISIINHAREEGESDLRQVRTWVENRADEIVEAS